MPASIAFARHPGPNPRGPPHHAWPQLSHCVWERHRPFWMAVQLTAAHSRFLCWMQCRHSHLSGEQLGQSVFRKGVCLVHFSGLEPHRTPGCGIKPAGSGPRHPSGSRLSPAGCGSKSQSRLSPRPDPIYARPAGGLCAPPQG